MKGKIVKRTIFKLNQALTYHLGLVEEEKKEKLDIKKKSVSVVQFNC